MPGTATDPKPGKATVGTQYRFLGDILGIGYIAQDAARNPERQRAAFLEALFKLAPKGGFLKIERQLGLRRATGPREFLHLFSPYNCQTPLLGFEFDLKSIFMMNAGRVRFCIRSVARAVWWPDSTELGRGHALGVRKIEDYKYPKQNRHQMLSTGVKLTVVTSG